MKLRINMQFRNGAGYSSTFNNMAEAGIWMDARIDEEYGRNKTRVEWIRFKEMEDTSIESSTTKQSTSTSTQEKSLPTKN